MKPIGGSEMGARSSITPRHTSACSRQSTPPARTAAARRRLKGGEDAIATAGAQRNQKYRPQPDSTVAARITALRL
jgi:hypothetical protein